MSTVSKPSRRQDSIDIRGAVAAGTNGALHPDDLCGPDSHTTVVVGVEPPTLAHLLWESLSNGMTIDEAADAALAKASAKELRRLALPVVRDHARRLLRNATHAKERESVRMIREDRVPFITAVQALVRDTAWVPTIGDTPSTRVTWDELTAEQHRARAKWHRDQAGGLLATAELHEQAADEIERAGVTCLRDMDAAT